MKGTMRVRSEAATRPDEAVAPRHHGGEGDDAGEQHPAQHGIDRRRRVSAAAGRPSIRLRLRSWRGLFRRPVDDDVRLAGEIMRIGAGLAEQAAVHRHAAFADRLGAMLLERRSAPAPPRRRRAACSRTTQPLVAVTRFRLQGLSRYAFLRMNIGPLLLVTMSMRSRRPLSSKPSVRSTGWPATSARLGARLVDGDGKFVQALSHPASQAANSPKPAIVLPLGDHAGEILVVAVRQFGRDHADVDPAVKIGMCGLHRRRRGQRRSTPSTKENSERAHREASQLTVCGTGIACVVCGL